MKMFAKIATFTFTVLLAMAAFAADPAASKLSLHLTEGVTIAGTKLDAGDYNVFVTRDGDGAKVRVTNGPKEVVNTTAKFRSMDKFPNGVAISKTTSREVVELQSKKIGGALVFNTSNAPAAADGSSK